MPHQQVQEVDQGDRQKELVVKGVVPNLSTYGVQKYTFFIIKIFILFLTLSKTTIQHN